MRVVFLNIVKFVSLYHVNCGISVVLFVCERASEEIALFVWSHNDNIVVVGCNKFVRTIILTNFFRDITRTRHKIIYA